MPTSVKLLRIEYCAACGYRGRAASLAAELEAATAASVDLVPCAAGAFDVYADGRLVFSKGLLGRFPTAAQVLDRLEAVPA